MCIVYCAGVHILLHNAWDLEHVMHGASVGQGHWNPSLKFIRMIMRRMKWAVHVLRMGENRWALQVLCSKTLVIRET
jgi:hypothetical protein